MATSREQMAAAAGGGGLARPVIPKLELPAIPPRVLKSFPEMASWHEEANKVIERWRVDNSAVQFGS